MRNFGIKTLFLFVTLFAVGLPFGYRPFANHYASNGMTGILRAQHIPDTGFRLFVLCDEKSQKAAVVVIEKWDPANAPAALEPSFCEIDVSESGTRLEIDGKSVFPAENLVAYFARPNEPPKMVILDRDEYNRLTDDGIMPCYSDQDVWDLCINAADE